MSETYITREVGNKYINANLVKKVMKPKIGLFGFFENDTAKQFKEEQIIGELTINIVADYESVEELHREIACVIQKWCANHGKPMMNNTNNENEMQLIEESQSQL
jgi:hypothetical protein